MAEGMIDKDDVEITHNKGKTVVKGVGVGEMLTFREAVKRSMRGSLDFYGVKKIERLRLDGTPHQTIYGDKENAR